MFTIPCVAMSAMIMFVNFVATMLVSASVVAILVSTVPSGCTGTSPGTRKSSMMIIPGGGVVGVVATRGNGNALGVR